MKKVFLSVFALATVGLFTTSCSSEGGSSDDTEIKPDDNPDGGGTPSNDAKFVHKVIVEDVTGTWCGWCPRVAEAIIRVKDHPKGKFVIPVAIHYGDSMQIGSASVVVNDFGEKYGTPDANGNNSIGFPFALINRDVVWSGDQPNNKSAVLNKIQNDSPIGIKIASELTVNSSTGAGSGTITTSFKFNQGYQNLKYVIYVLENEVVRQGDAQSNYTEYFGGASSIPSFVHNDVVRAVSGNILGNTLGNVTSGQEVVKSNQQVSFSLFNKDLEKVEVVVYVMDSNGKVLNAQIAHANETKNYETK